MTPATLNELAERVERAEGPDRGLDVDIVYALYPDIGPYQGQCIGDDPIFWHDPYRKQEAPHFTSSLDSALSLVPQGWDWEVAHEPWLVKSTNGGKARASYAQLADGDLNSHATRCLEARAHAPALALTAASLRARAAIAATAEREANDG